MNAAMYYVGGSKGGVGKSKLSFALIDYLFAQEKKILLLETDTSNPDVYKTHHPHESDSLISKIIDLDVAEGWIKLVNYADEFPEHTVVINSAARSNTGITKYGEMLRETLGELDRELVTFWMLNRQRDSLELLRGFLNSFPDALIYACRNMYFGAPVVECLSKYYKNLPYTEHKQPKWRYYYHNQAFSYADAIWLYSMLREFAPGRIIEVGSGFSSCVMLDTAGTFLRKQPEMLFIDPNPQRLYDNMGTPVPGNVRVMPQEVQSVPMETFDALQDGDILFLDSSHVGKIGSDLLHLLFAVLPRLARGVLVHFHDIFYPFEYPLDWVKGGCAWNENYFVRSFLQYNDAFEILLFGDFLGKKHPELLRERMPLCLKNTGGSLWLRKK